ncbi:CPBP family intramembrane glutamic endopeptidase [uncultured Paraglaciecola sp.]|uniref:CPBP family intramembrane glutamic endopeptidase n=1 Tax=uncultured Paraglaciecola sp. TaxID=1765024 RepID=UPI00262134AF|nr:CPBP family intramembrane glutamic endopeptidase [uncultured Paraglaciecola sp.]
MIVFEFLLISYFIGYPVYVYFTHDNLKQRMLANPAMRIKLYKETMVFLWVPALVVLFLIFQDRVSATTVGLNLHWNLANQLMLGGLVILSGYLLFSLKQIANNQARHQEIADKFSYVQWLMPTTLRELKYYAGGVSVSAGVCEELLFRGYLLGLITEYSSTPIAVIVSSLAFGLPHIYQGIPHVIRTTVFGVFMALITVLTDSIIAAILLHIIMDIFSGCMAYIVAKQPK